jgi:putative transposase
MRPPRLGVLFTRYDQPIYFVTACTLNRAKWLAKDDVHASLLRFAANGGAEGKAALGGYILMPDHLHLFVRLSPDITIGAWVKALKAALLRNSDDPTNRWQPGFFDHVIRNRESYSQKWMYVRENAVRAGLVTAPDDWPYQGEVFSLSV